MPAVALLSLAQTASRTPDAVSSPRVPFAHLGRQVATAAGFRARATVGCDGTTALVCSVVDVPLDRTGAVPGTIPLHVEMLPQADAENVVFLLAGGPGQPSAETFDLGDPLQANYLRFLFPSSTLVAYDDRGTGLSAPLHCSAIDQGAPGADDAQIAAACAAELGAGAAFYGTADGVADLDAVRAALGFDRIAIMGVSYGTRQALAYAAAYPTHVDRLVLDSVVPPGEDEAFRTGVLQALPATLARFCEGGRCARATSDFPGDVVAVASRLAATPDARLPLSALDFLSLVIGGDLDPGLAAELPAAVHAARIGDMRPLRHVLEIVGGWRFSSVNGAAYLATICADAGFPWQRAVALPERETALRGAVAALPAGSFGPFGPWASGLGVAGACAGWPSSGGTPPAPAAFPDVPVLAISGGLDLRTPTAGAAQVVADFPQGKLLVVPGAGHSVLTADTSLCSQLDVRQWMSSGLLVRDTCPRAEPDVPPVAAFPGPARRRLTAASGRALAAATLREAEAAWDGSAGDSGQKTAVGGVAGGSLVARATSFSLARYALAPGVALTGQVSVVHDLPPLRFSGSVRVAGAVHGTLTLDGTQITGRLSAGRG